jgi:hypothetical protein
MTKEVPALVDVTHVDIHAVRNREGRSDLNVTDQAWPP